VHGEDGAEVVSVCDRDEQHNYRFSIRLKIVHPSLRPDESTQALKLEPTRAWLLGEPRMTLRRAPLSGFRQETYWTVSYPREDTRDFFSEVSKFLDRITPAADFLRGIAATVGLVEVIVNLPGDVNIGASLDLSDLHRLAAMQIRLGIEVFPGFP
jgi:hypothetical protein